MHNKCMGLYGNLSLICKTMIRAPLEKDDLGDPSRKAYSNMSEAVNHKLSVCCLCRQPVISLVEVVHEEVQSKQDEVIRTLYCRGKCKLCSEYKHLEAFKEDWFQARPKQCPKCIQRINKPIIKEPIAQKTLYFP